MLTSLETLGGTGAGMGTGTSMGMGTGSGYLGGGSSWVGIFLVPFGDLAAVVHLDEHRWGEVCLEICTAGNDRPSQWRNAGTFNWYFSHR